MDLRKLEYPLVIQRGKGTLMALMKKSADPGRQQGGARQGIEVVKTKPKTQQQQQLLLLLQIQIQIQIQIKLELSGYTR